MGFVFVLRYELMDETMDFGYPQTCSVDVLKLFINTGKALFFLVSCPFLYLYLFPCCCLLSLYLSSLSSFLSLFLSFPWTLSLVLCLDKLLTNTGKLAAINSADSSNLSSQITGAVDWRGCLGLRLSFLVIVSCLVLSCLFFFVINLSCDCVVLQCFFCSCHVIVFFM